jgi:succinyl-CoA synthetase alpha subunit/malate-CoA ligase subunit alpha
MSILVDRETRVVVQGITGKLARYHAERMLDYGTKIPAGVVPGRGGTEVAGVPVFDTVKQAVAATGADTSLVAVPPPFAADAVLEAAEAGVAQVFCITEGIPAQDMIRVKAHVRRAGAGGGMLLTGPNSAGAISPGKAMVGVMPVEIFTEGRVGIVSRSASLSYEAAAQMRALGIGVSTCVGIGGDAINGASFTDMMARFEVDDETDLVCLIGEAGGPQEADAAHHARAAMTKPVVACLVGPLTTGKRAVGHAGAILAAFGAGAADGVEGGGGITLVERPSIIGETVARVLEETTA